MKIGQKIMLYFASVGIILTGIFFIFIYTLVSEYRRSEFQQRLRDNAMTTLRFMAEAEDKDRQLLQSIDRFNINNLLQEKVLLYDENKNLVYSGIDDTEIVNSARILATLSPEVPTVETVEEEYEVVGTFLTLHDNTYYGIVKAYDIFGHSKLEYLRNVLIFSYLLFSGIVLITTYYISSQIVGPLRKMAMEISEIRLDSGRHSITVPDDRDEINFLARQFNELMKNLNEAFSFQKHLIHHVSHELKTPIAILVSNFEKMEAEQDIAKLKRHLKSQKEDTHNLSNIINALLEISKAESGNVSGLWEPVRVDDLIYDLIDEIHIIRPEFSFEVQIDPSIDNEDRLTISGNKRLLNSAFMNLLVNCSNYSSDAKARIYIANDGRRLKIVFENRGEIISVQERQFLFQHFFRGTNSRGIRGFGLGLVLIHKIMELHNGRVWYSSEGADLNIFTLEFSLLEEGS